MGYNHVAPQATSPSSTFIVTKTVSSLCRAGVLSFKAMPRIFAMRVAAM
ncbi:hypothetical protein KCP75_04920 [Salmonella enterica subsp. enterica]|nr:hypothetical protein KCP75_04920 [Salmonella enterica subsp. enterica]